MKRAILILHDPRVESGCSVQGLHLDPDERSGNLKAPSALVAREYR
jgi:hypothetical protein